MTLANDIRRTIIDTTLVYAAVGVTDLAVERLREVRNRAAAVRMDLAVKAIQDRAVKRFEKVAEQVQQVPVQVRNQTVDVAGRARETYSGFAERGEKLVKHLRDQKSTEDLFAQAGNAVFLGKGADTTVRKAAHDIQCAALVTLNTGRRGAASVAALVQGGVKTNGLKLRRPIAGIATTAKKSTASSERAVRSVAPATRKTATRSAKTATPNIASPKADTTEVGD